MTHRHFLAILSATFLAPAAFAAENPPRPLELKIVSFNLRYRNAADKQKGDGWDDTRRPAVATVLRKLDADVIGTQEGLVSQLRDIARDLPAYAWAGVGRKDGKSRGEFTAVFYKKERFDLLETQNFWLSETPETPGSRSWKSACERVLTAARLREKNTGRQLWFLNSHFDHVSELARQKSAELVLERLKKLDPAVPVFFTADFNTAAVRSKTYKALTVPGAFLDTWELAAERLNPDYDTYQGFNRNPKRNARGATRIDWILVRPVAGAPLPKVFKAGVIIDRRPDGGFPSDHFPVSATLSLP
jgi:endonuclease/exonuclease/phosphatase family metal-dependent hydrolase